MSFLRLENPWGQEGRLLMLKDMKTVGRKVSCLLDVMSFRRQSLDTSMWEFLRLTEVGCTPP